MPELVNCASAIASGELVSAARRKPGLLEPLNRGQYIGVRRERAHPAQYRPRIHVRQGHAAPRRHHLQRRTSDLAEVAVGSGHHREQRALQHLPEPLVQHVAVAEHPLELRLQRTQVQQGFVDVEHDHSLGHPLS